MQCQLNIILLFSMLRYVISFPISVNSEVTVRNISWTNKIIEANNGTDTKNLLQHATWVKPHFPNCWENLNSLLRYNNSLFGKGLCVDVCSQMKTSCNMLKDEMMWNSLTCKKKIRESDCLSKVCRKETLVTKHSDYILRVNDVVLVFLLLTLNIFHSFF